MCARGRYHRCCCCCVYVGTVSVVVTSACADVCDIGVLVDVDMIVVGIGCVVVEPVWLYCVAFAYVGVVQVVWC